MLSLSIRFLCGTIFVSVDGHTHGAINLSFFIKEGSKQNVPIHVKQAKNCNNSNNKTNYKI
jgi:hypothetical protein